MVLRTNLLSMAALASVGGAAILVVASSSNGALVLSIILSLVFATAAIVGLRAPQLDQRATAVGIGVGTSSSLALAGLVSFGLAFLPAVLLWSATARLDAKGVGLAPIAAATGFGFAIGALGLVFAT